MAAIVQGTVRVPALPRAGEVADAILASMLGRGAAAAWVEPLGQGESEAHRISLERGREVIGSAVLSDGLGDAVLARLALLCGIDLVSGQPQSGRCRVRLEGRESDLLLTVRSADGSLWGELRVLDDRGAEVGATVALPPEGGEYAEILEPGTSVGAYRVDSVLGRGGMGVVYRVEHVLLRRSFALKVLLKRILADDPGSALRFVREARAAARVRDEGIVEVTDFGRLADGRPYLVMELLAGYPLADLTAGGPVEPLRAVALARRIARALGAAHAAGVIHRDLTPSNVFVEDAGGQERVKLVDFGGAKLLLDPELAEVPDGPPGIVFGTPYYMAPEHARGQDTDARSDIYSLGVVLFELLSGRVPFEGETVREVVMKHIVEPAPPLEVSGDELPPELARLVGRCLAKDPADRYQSAAALIEELDWIWTLLRRRGWKRFLR